MILAYGSYRHALAEAGLSIRRETQFTANGVPTSIRERWRIDGVLQAESPEAVTRAIHELQTAYSRQAQDVALYLPDGTTPTAHVILSRDTIGGVRVTQSPSFPQGRGAEYSTFRSYTIELEADLPVAREANPSLHWEEVLSFSRRTAVGLSRHARRATGATTGARVDSVQGDAIRPSRRPSRVSHACRADLAVGLASRCLDDHASLAASHRRWHCGDRNRF